MPSKMWHEIIYPFPNFNSATVEVSEWIDNFIMDYLFHPALYNGCNYLFMLGEKLIHVNKRVPA